MLSEQELQALRDQHGDIVHLVGKGGRWECVFRAPKRAEFKMFKANTHDPSKVADANEVLAIQTVVYPPSREAFLALLEKFPAIPESMANSDDFRAMTGVAVEETAKI